jgi:hypothetical protein
MLHLGCISFSGTVHSFVFVVFLIIDVPVQFYSLDLQLCLILAQPFSLLYDFFNAVIILVLFPISFFSILLNLF